MSDDSDVIDDEDMQQTMDEAVEIQREARDLVLQKLSSDAQMLSSLSVIALTFFLASLEVMKTFSLPVYGIDVVDVVAGAALVLSLGGSGYALYKLLGVWREHSKKATLIAQIEGIRSQNKTQSVVDQIHSKVRNNDNLTILDSDGEPVLDDGGE